MHPDYVRKLPKRCLRWTSQKSQTKAKERGEEEMGRWKEVEFPHIIREARQRNAHLIFLDESCSQLAPTMPRTLPPLWRTPILPCRDNRDKISSVRAITLTPGRHAPGSEFWPLPDRRNFSAGEVSDSLRLMRQRHPCLTVV